MDGEDWTCPICLELIYEPCANQCGHIFCYWCMHKAMNAFTTSSCPACRSPFSHFPRVSKALHNFLRANFSEQYAARAEEVRAEGCPGTSSNPPGTGVAAAQGDVAGHLDTDVDLQQRFRCAHPACSQLLVKPTVLNCGHLVCLETCAHDESLVALRACPACGEATSEGEPKVCIKVHEFLERMLPEEQRVRAAASRELMEQRRAQITTTPTPAEPLQHLKSKTALFERLLERRAGAEQDGDPTHQNASPAARLEQARQHLLDNYVHHGVGCDQCGKYPIVGDRFQCVQCSQCEDMGFDLCSSCMSVDPKLVRGRFNQHHTPDHTMRKVDKVITDFHIVQFLNPGTPIWELLRLMEMQFGSGRGDEEDDEEVHEPPPPIPALVVDAGTAASLEDLENRGQNQEEVEGTQQGADGPLPLQLQDAYRPSLVHRNSWRPDELEGLLPMEYALDLDETDDESDDMEEEEHSNS